MIVLDPVAVDVVGHPERKVLGPEFYEAGFTKPAVENIRRHRGAKLLGDGGPNRAEVWCLFCVIHRVNELGVNGRFWLRTVVKMHFGDALF